MSDAPNGIFDQLCPPLPQELEHDQYLLKLVTLAISNELPKIEHLLGLLCPNSEFRDDLSHAILRCILTNTSPPKRRSQICRELKQISDDAAAAEEINRRLMSLLQVSNIYPPVKSRFLKH